jgi:hypothetical protein
LSGYDAGMWGITLDAAMNETSSCKEVVVVISSIN